jgi:glycosyltransferase involved in cell wall biosynthesis
LQKNSFGKNGRFCLKKKYPHVRFIIVGDRDPGNPSNPDERFFADVLADKTFEYWGYREDMENVLNEADIVVLPTYGEGLPKALLEAAACGKPIVTTNVSGCRECVIPNQTGFLVAPKQVEPLVQSISHLIDSLDLRIKYGHAGRKLIEENFGITGVLAQTLNVYDNLLDPRPANKFS